MLQVSILSSLGLGGRPPSRYVELSLLKCLAPTKYRIGTIELYLDICFFTRIQVLLRGFSVPITFPVDTTCIRESLATPRQCLHIF